MVEAAAGAALAAAIIVIASLPNRFTGLERDIRQVLMNQTRLETRVETVWNEVRNHDRRLIRLEAEK